MTAGNIFGMNNADLHPSLIREQEIEAAIATANSHEAFQAASEHLNISTELYSARSLFNTWTRNYQSLPLAPDAIQSTLIAYRNFGNAICNHAERAGDPKTSINIYGKIARIEIFSRALINHPINRSNNV